MPIWLEETPSASCPTCGVDTALWRPSVVNLTWRNDAEREADAHERRPPTHTNRREND